MAYDGSTMRNALSFLLFCDHTKLHAMKLLLFFLMNVSILHAQQTFIGGKEGARPLQWSDFSGKPDKSAPYDAYTYWNIRSKMNPVPFHGDTAVVTGTVWVELGEKSWLKEGRGTEELLRHEQGHFNIGRLCMLEIAEKIKTTYFSRSDYGGKLTALFRETIEKYRTLELKYDADTRHSANKEEQGKWNAYFDEKLEK